MLEPDRHPDDLRALAQSLRALRKAAKLSGERVAARCAMSQTKISRIETGRIIPTPEDVERILTALSAPAEVVAELVERARVATMAYTANRALAEAGLWRTQDAITSLIRSSTEIRHLLPVIPSGLLQTEAYARAVMTPVIPGDVDWDSDKAVIARLASQATLTDTAKRFSFVLTENAVRWPVAAAPVMGAQAAHLAALSTRPNLDISLVPRDTGPLPFPPLNTVVIYDDRLVTIEGTGGQLVLRDPKDVLFHRNVFDYFHGRAQHGDAATMALARIAGEFMPERE